KAEEAFIQTLTEDEQFHWAYYNLGLVYMGLGEKDAAYVAFRKALERQNCQRWEPYYALAQIRVEYKKTVEVKKTTGTCAHYELDDPRAIEGLCRRLIALKPRSAKGYRLLSLVQRETGRLEEAARSGERAVAHIWLSLCSEYWRRRSVEPENNVIPQYLS